MRTDRSWIAPPYAVFAATAAVVLLANHLLAWTVPELAASMFGATLTAACAAVAWKRLGLLPLRRAEARAAALLRAVPHPFVVLNRDGVVLAANAAADARFGNGGRLAGQPLFGRQPSEEGRHVLGQLREAARNKRSVCLAEVWGGVRMQFDAVPVGGGEPGSEALVVHVLDGTVEQRDAGIFAIGQELDEARPADAEAAAIVLDQVCRRLLALLGMRMVWVGHRGEGGAVTALALAGRDMDLDAELHRVPHGLDDNVGGRSPVGTALRTGTAQVAAIGDAGVQDWHKAARRHGVRSMCAVPAKVESGVTAVLVLASRDPDAFADERLRAALQALAARIGAVLAAAADRERLSTREAALESVSEAVFVTDRAGVIEWVNGGFSTLTGYPREEVLGRTPRLLKSDRHDPELYREIWATISSGSTWSGELVNRRRDGTLYTARQTILPIRHGSGVVMRFLAIQEDVGMLHALEERMEHMAQFDALTDLPNRALFLDRLDHGIAIARRNHHSLALLTLNLDHFRIVNDSFGLAAGDVLLQGVATRLRQAVRDSDTVARLGGDEFAVIAPQILVREDAGRVAQKLMEALRPAFGVDGQELKVAASIGVALFPQDGETAEQLITRSSAALKLVKMQDRNAYKFASVG